MIEREYDNPMLHISSIFVFILYIYTNILFDASGGIYYSPKSMLLFFLIGTCTHGIWMVKPLKLKQKNIYAANTNATNQNMICGTIFYSTCVVWKDRIGF